jgi:DNA invertase Pin-like site-specific DNA recombinase
MPALIGYARVSTEDQNMALQLDALTAVVCLRIFSDKASGAHSHRPGLALCLEHLRPGDTLVVWKLDRLGRSVRHLCEMLAKLEADGVQFRSLTENIDTTSAMGRLYFHIAAAFSQMERELTVERIRAGQASARARGVTGGRRKILSQKKIDAARVFFAQGLRGKEIASTLGCSVPTLYRALPASVRQAELFP